MHHLRPFAASDADWLVERHQTLYRAAEGFDDSFGPLVAGIISDFLANPAPGRAAAWVATDNDRRLGSIFVVPFDDKTAKLRLFLLEPAARGTGLAGHMLTCALTFARTAGFAKMQLWTHESHAAAGRLYARHGFVLTASTLVHSFGVDLVEQTWQITL